MTLRIAAFAGSLSNPSRTRALVESAASRAAARFGAEAFVHDLSDLQPSLGMAGSLGELHPKGRAIVDDILSADALIVGSPVYKGSYTGLFKHLFDLIDPQALAGKPVLLTATGGGQRHALVLEHQLRPLFGFFMAHTLPTAVYASTSDFLDYRVSAPALSARIDEAVADIGAFFPRLATAIAAE